MYLVMDVGATWTKYGYYTSDGKTNRISKYSTITSDIETFYHTIETHIVEGVEGVALSMPGLIDSKTGYVHAVTLLPFLVGHTITKELEKRVKVPVTLENDATCATLGEIWKGSLQRINSGLLVVLGSGIGATIIVDGKIYKSKHYKAGEIGSMLVPMDNTYQKMTNFGKKNSANALIQMISKETGCSNNGEIVFEEIKKNPVAKELFTLYCHQVAMMLYNLDYVLDLDVISIGGGISEQEILIATIQEQFLQLRTLYQEDNHTPIIVSSDLHNEANLVGALFHHLEIRNNG